VSIEMNWPLSQSVGGAGFVVLLFSNVAAKVVRRGR
jgi:hypothetical protein